MTLQEGFRKVSGKLPKLRHRITRTYDDIDPRKGKITRRQLAALFAKRAQQEKANQALATAAELASEYSMAEVDMEIILKYYSYDPNRQSDSPNVTKSSAINTPSAQTKQKK